MRTIDVDVLIVGAGIAGPALACALRKRGLSILILEKSAKPGDTARGDHLQPRTCEILDQWGVLGDLFQSGAEKRCGSRWCDQEGKQIFYSDIASLEVPHPYFAFLNHEKIGETLLQAALREEGVEIMRPIRNWWLTETDDAEVKVHVGLPDGSDVTVSAQVLVGADGRNSRVRKLAGIKMQSHRYERSIGVLFADLDRPYAGNDLHVYLQESRVVSVIPRNGGRCKIGIPLDAGEVSAWRQATDEQLQQRMQELLPAVVLNNVRFSDIYPPIYLRTDTWVRGRTVLIGDACHAMHPARSQGMNISIRCIDELAKALSGACTSPTTATVEHALTHYEQSLKPTIDAILAANHASGLEMDRSDQNNLANLKVVLTGLATTPAASLAHSMQAAGYG